MSVKGKKKEKPSQRKQFREKQAKYKPLWQKRRRTVKNKKKKNTSPDGNNRYAEQDGARWKKSSLVEIATKKKGENIFFDCKRLKAFFFTKTLFKTFWNGQKEYFSFFWQAWDSFYSYAQEMIKWPKPGETSAFGRCFYYMLSKWLNHFFRAKRKFSQIIFTGKHYFYLLISRMHSWQLKEWHI